MAVTLTDAQLDDVLAALEDAAEYRFSADDGCARCASGRICDDHRAMAQKAIRWASLALQLEKAARYG